MIDHADNVFHFDDFVVDADRRQLLRNGEPVHLKGKAFDVLLMLIENRGGVVSKNRILDTVWENQFVEENNLTVHITALRKALGEKRNEHRYIVTVPGRGYRFVGDMVEPSNGEVVVERTTLEKIVIDEEFEESSTDSGATNGHYAPASPNRLTTTVHGRSWRTPLVVGALLLAGLTIGGVYAYRSGLANDLFATAAPFQKHSVVQLTTTGKVGNAALSPDGKLFAYVIDDLGSKSLWMGNVDGGNHLPLRPAAEIVYTTLAFSRDSSQLLYSVRDEKNPTGALYRIPVMGGAATKLMDGVKSFALSPDGSRIATYISGDADTQIVTSLLDGTDRHEVAAFPKNHFSVFSSISWSPDGTRLALSLEQPGRMNRQALGFIELETGQISRISLPNYREITRTAWLGDGSGLIITTIEETSHSSVPQYRLVYVSYPDGEARQITADRSNYGASWHNDAGATLSLDAAGDSILTVEHRQLSNVWVAPADDLSAARQITFSSFGKYDGLWGLDWTPDGKIIYTTSDTRNQYLARMNSDGGEQVPLTNPLPDAGHVDSVLTVSADGRYILFHSNRVRGEFDIWRADIDGSNPKQLTFGGKSFTPAPSPDGKWVYYKSWLDDVGHLCRTTIEGGDPECLTDKETSWASFSPDGKFIAALYKTDKSRLAIFSAETHEVIREFDLPKSGTLYMGSRWTADGRAVTYRDTSYGYWIQPVDGGEPQRMTGLPMEKFYNFAWSKDGKQFAFVRGQEIRDVVLFTRKNP